MIEMQKLKCMQEFTFAINVECLYSSLQERLPKRNCARAEHAKTCFCSIKDFESSVEWKISAYDAHIQQQLISICYMSNFSKTQEMTEK